MTDSDYRLTIASILRPAEIRGVADKILTAADGVISADPASLERKQFVTLSELNESLTTALGERQTEDPQKEAKEKAERRRDTGFVRVKTIVNGIFNDEEEEDQELKAAAATIKQILAAYPANVHNTQQDENTALLDSLVPKLRQEPAASAIAALGLTPYVDRMHDGNEEFKAAKDASAAGRSQGTPADRAAANPVRWHGSQFASNLAYLGETDVAFAPLAAQVQQIIDDAEAIARARKTRRESDGEDEQPPPTA